MSPAAKLSIGFSESPSLHHRNWGGRLYRRMMTAHPVIKVFIALAGIAVVGYVDLVSGDELSFSIFYLLPVAYATWFIGAKSGLMVAAICGVVWFFVDVALLPRYLIGFIAIWNGAVRLFFFVL